MPEVFPLVVRDLCVERNGNRLLAVPELALEASERVGIVGPNGAGKSLLLRALTGLVNAEQGGAVRWGGAPPGPAVLRRCGVVMQHPLMLRRSVRDNLRWAVSRQLKHAEVDAAVEHALALSGLTEHAGRSARVLSGGERMRLAVARAMALSPAALLLDEPTASLDHSAARQVESLVRDSVDSGTTLVLISHDLALVERLCDRVVLMHRGSVVCDTPTATFFDAPPTAEAAAFVRGEYLE
ncbi:MAG: ABC transporter ATP-binding protein [Pseudomonadota bacterium]